MSICIKKIFGLTMALSLITSFVSANNIVLQAEPNGQGAGNNSSPYMMNCRYRNNIYVTVPNPTAVFRNTIVYNSSQIADIEIVTGFDAGFFPSQVIASQKIDNNKLFFERNRSSSAIPTNAYVGHFFFRSALNVLNASFSLPFDSSVNGPNVITNANNTSENQVTATLPNTFAFLTGPCLRDATAPIFDPSNGATLYGNTQTTISGAYRVVTGSALTINITDNTESFNTNNNGDVWNNEPTRNGSQMTRSNYPASINQMGVDTSTISMTVTASAYCHKFQFNGGDSCISAKPVQSESITYTLNTTPSNMTAVPLDASVTWEQLPRNQKITIQESNQRFFIERQITVTGTVRDRVNRRGLQNQRTFTYVFNTPRAPTLTGRIPAPGGQVFEPIDKVIIGVEDDRAGVDPQTLHFTIAGLVYTGGSSGVTYTYSLRSPGNPWLGDRYIYTIPLRQTLPAGTVNVRVTGFDLVGTPMDVTYQFQNFACGGGVAVHIGTQRSGGVLSAVPDGVFQFYGPEIFVPGLSALFDRDDNTIYRTDIPQNIISAQDGGFSCSTSDSPTVDFCPNGDNSPSIYDGICNMHTSAPEGMTPRERLQIIMKNYAGQQTSIRNACPFNKTFEDILRHPHRQAIEILYCFDIVRGYNPREFGPDGFITRAEFIKMLINTILVSEGKPIVDENKPRAGSLPYADVIASAWFAGHFSIAHQKNILGFMETIEYNTRTKKNQNLIKPDQLLTKDEAMRLLEAGLNIQGASPLLYQFIRNEFSSIADDRFTSIKRGEIAAIMVKAFDIQTNKEQLRNSNHLRMLQQVSDAIREKTKNDQIIQVSSMIATMMNQNPKFFENQGLDRNLLISDLRKTLDESFNSMKNIIGLTIVPNDDFYAQFEQLVQKFNPVDKKKAIAYLLDRLGAMDAEEIDISAHNNNQLLLSAIKKMIDNGKFTDKERTIQYLIDRLNMMDIRVLRGAYKIDRDSLIFSLINLLG